MALLCQINNLQGAKTQTTHNLQLTIMVVDKVIYDLRVLRLIFNFQFLIFNQCVNVSMIN